MGKVSTFGQTEEPMKVSGETTYYMVMEFILGQKEEATKVSLKTI
jgi:hypothetical protein